jgi:hypothetical protein
MSAEQLNFPFVGRSPDAPVVRPRHVEWLRLANSGEGFCAYGWGWLLGWKRHFYFWKSKFLQRAGELDGWDLQVIRLKCHGCGGSGTWHSEYGDHSDLCRRCGGDGIYRVDAVKLTRWRVGGSVFHVPGERTRWVSWDLPMEEESGFRERITGLIKHEPVPERVAIRAFLKLLYVFDPEEFWEAIEQIVEEWALNKRRRFTQWLSRKLLAMADWVETSESRWAEGFYEWFGPDELEDDIPF